MIDGMCVCVCMCMRVLCLRGGCMFCVTSPAFVFSYLFNKKSKGDRDPPTHTHTYTHKTNNVQGNINTKGPRWFESLIW